MDLIVQLMFLLIYFSPTSWFEGWWSIAYGGGNLRACLRGFRGLRQSLSQNHQMVIGQNKTHYFSHSCLMKKELLGDTKMKLSERLAGWSRGCGSCCSSCWGASLRVTSGIWVDLCAVRSLANGFQPENERVQRLGFKWFKSPKRWGIPCFSHQGLSMKYFVFVTRAFPSARGEPSTASQRSLDEVMWSQWNHPWLVWIQGGWYVASSRRFLDSFFFAILFAKFTTIVSFAFPGGPP